MKYFNIFVINNKYNKICVFVDWKNIKTIKYLDFVELQLIESKSMLALLFGFIFFMGIFISWISTHFATQRFLNLRTDELYY